MTPRRTRVLLAILATATIVAGGLVLRFFSVAPERGALGPAKAPTTVAAAPTPGRGVGAGLSGPFLRGLRGHSVAGPESAAPLDTMTLLENPEPWPDQSQSAAPPSPVLNAPLPPKRPADLAGQAETAVPLPPPRPAELAAIPEVPPHQEPAATPEPQENAAAPPPQASPVLANAPLPPVRPRDLAALSAPALPPQAPAAPAMPAAQAPMPSPAASAPAQQIAAHTEPVLRPAPEESFNTSDQPPARFNMGAPVYVRIFKKEGELELWLKHNGRYALYRSFPICKWSGRLGPKLREADYQSPEGFYSVSARQLNPHSNYHRAFNVGYPNAFDRQNGRTGGLVMVHGNCKSVGCFAMTDKGIEEIYGFVAAAIAGGQRDVPVHIFPFRMTDAAIARESGNGGFLSFLATESANAAQWNGFWHNLKEGYDLFQQTGEPPTAYACGDHYAFGQAGESCHRIAGW